MYVQNRMLHNRNPYTVANLGISIMYSQNRIAIKSEPLFCSSAQFFQRFGQIGDLENSRLHYLQYQQIFLKKPVSCKIKKMSLQTVVAQQAMKSKNGQKYWLHIFGSKMDHSAVLVSPHSSEIRGLRSTKYSSERLQNLHRAFIR